MNQFKRIVGRVGCVALVLGVQGFAWGQDRKEEKKPAPQPPEMKAKEGQPPAAGEMDEMTKKMMEAGALGPHHEHLKYFVGAWTCTVKAYFMGPEPQVSQGTATFAPIHGGRFITQTFKGSFGGEPFEGFGLMGFDNVSKKHVSIWTDSMSTCIATAEGTCDASGKVYTATMTHNDPATGKPKAMKESTKIVDENTFTFTMFETGPDGKDAPVLEITYKRG